MKKMKIVRIPILPLNMMNAFLIRTEDSCILVDTGIPNSEPNIEKVLKKEGLTYQDIKLIILTHAHTDHAGSAANVQKNSQAPIVAHEKELAYLRGEASMTYTPTSLFGSLFLKTGRPRTPYLPVEPDLLLSGTETLDLQPYGVEGRVKYTPGHTDGSISVELANKEVIAGDLIASGVLLGGLIMNHKAQRPPFEDDPHLTGKALQGLLDDGMERFYMGHGGPLEAPEVQRHVTRLMKMKPATTNSPSIG